MHQPQTQDILGRLVRLVAILWITVGTAAAGPGEFENGVLQPLADGFPNRPITLVNDDEAGSREGVYARSLQAALRDIAPVPVRVSDEPGPAYANWIRLRELSERDGGGDGYQPVIVTIPGMTMQLLVEPLEMELGVTEKDMNLVIATETIPYVLVQRKDAPWGKSFAGLVDYARKNPGKLKYTSNQVGTGNDIAMEWIMDGLGFKVTKIPCTTNQAAVSAVGAGEADFSLTQSDVAIANFEAGRVDVVLVTGSKVPAPWDKDSNVVTAEEAGLPAAPWGIVEGLAVPRDTQPEHIEWLYKLFRAAAESEHHKRREHTVPGTQIAVIAPAEANEMKRSILLYAEPIIRKLHLHYEQHQ